MRPVVNDAYHARVGGYFRGVPRKTGLLAADEEHRLADPCTNRIDGHERSTDGAAVGAYRLQHEQCEAVQMFVFAGDDDVTDDSGELHRRSVAGGDFYGVDDADDRGVNGAVLEA